MGLKEIQSLDVGLRTMPLSSNEYSPLCLTAPIDVKLNHQNLKGYVSGIHVILVGEYVIKGKKVELQNIPYYIFDISV